MTLVELRDEVAKLSFAERAELSRLLHGWEDDDWDQQIAKDAAAGRLDGIIARAEADMTAARFRPLP
ncbi:MAG TPA: hypothetical protein VMB21_06930 [Candidatus Limnocylindria bacterium]|nr:hypothetical protein [Candidatus Limnocylindria bacterium]